MKTLPRSYCPSNPSETILYQTIRDWLPTFESQLSSGYPDFVKHELHEYLKCGQLFFGFTRRQCESCYKDTFQAFRCSNRGFCPTCCAGRGARVAAHLVDNVFPDRRIRQWVITFPMPLRFMMARNQAIHDSIHRLVIEEITEYYIKKLGYNIKTAKCGSVSFIQTVGSALNLNVHFHILFTDGVWFHRKEDASLVFRSAPPPTEKDRVNPILS